MMNTLLIACLAVDSNTKYDIYGIMVCRSSHWVMGTWLALYAKDFKKLVILDGTDDQNISKLVKKIVEPYRNVIHIFESSVKIDGKKTDNHLRGIAWSYLNATEVLGNWVVIAHPDEFFPISFVDIARKADMNGHNLVRSRSLMAVPYIGDRRALEEGIHEGPQCFNILNKVSRCLASYRFTEVRMYKYHSHEVKWNKSHSIVYPEIFPNKSKGLYGFFLHYKIHNFGENTINKTTGRFTHSVWSAINPVKFNLTKYDGNIGIYSYFNASVASPTQCIPWVESMCRQDKAFNCDRLKCIRRQAQASSFCTTKHAVQNVSAIDNHEKK